MQKIRLHNTCLLLVEVSLIILAACTFTESSNKKESERIREKMKAVSESTMLSPDTKIVRYNTMRFELAAEYIKENEPDQAIEILSELIKKESEPQRDFYGKSTNRSFASYGREAAYYNQLALAFELKENLTGRDKALEKAAQARMQEARLKTAEGRDITKKE